MEERVMSEHDEMNENWEARINAMLDGELDQQEMAELKREAEDNAELARAIVEAYALQASLDELHVERAPDSLRAKLAAIPTTARKQSARWFGMPRWVPAGAMAAIPLLVIAMVMMQPDPASGPERTAQPEFTEAEIRKAREEVMIAFAYLDRIGERTGKHIESELAEELGSSVTENISRYMPYTGNSEQEESS